MRSYCLLSILMLSLHAFSQKTYQLTFENEDHVDFVKNPTTVFKDSVSLVNYVGTLQTSAITKGYLLASVDDLTFSNRIAKLNFYLGERFDQANVTLEQEELDFLRKHSRLNEQFIAQLDFTPKALGSALKSIHETYLNNGYPFARLQFVSLEEEK